MSKFRLYHYWRSSSSWRVRWALAIKQIDCEWVDVDLLSGESESAAHLERNPLGYVPVLDVSPQLRLIESLPIIEWLDEKYPKPALLPKDPDLRAKTRILAEIINAGTQPIQNLSVTLLHAPENQAEQKKWMQHWTRNGLQAYETLVKGTAGKFSVGDSLTLADLCLIPQVYNANRQSVDLSPFPTVSRIYAAARETETCKKAEPEAFEPK
ncbi:maleylacetoacetate isomerase [bacterium]|jgi:maleylacetoacetate isomerase|nr:maleylacetoacetate isomerase [bacterium]